MSVRAQPTANGALPPAELGRQLSERIEDVARVLLGEPNLALSTRTQLRYGTHGSLAIEIGGDRRGTWYDHERGVGGGVIDLIRHHTRLEDGHDMADWLHAHIGMPVELKPRQAKPKRRMVAVYNYRDENGELLFQVCRYEPKSFSQRRPDGHGGWIWSIEGVRQVPYRLPQLLERPEGTPVYICEGEKDCERLASLGLVATCNPGGAGKWSDELSAYLRGAVVHILPDADEAGRKHAGRVAASLHGVAESIRIIDLPGLPPKGDVSDWLDAAGDAGRLLELGEMEPLWTPPHEAHVSESPRMHAGVQPTEDGIALAFAERHKDDLRFCHHAGKWYVWTGTRWQKEETRLAFDWARKICRDLNTELKDKLARAGTAAAVERFAQADRKLAVTSEIWDADPFLLGTPAGVVDLRTGRLRPAERTDYITRQTAVAPAFSAECLLWNRFLDEVTLGDKGLQRFLQQVAGYCLTGDVREHALFFVYGPGGNGKSVFLNVLAGLLGDYATTAAMDTFTASATDKHPTDLAMLQGARMVCASETEEGRAWAESRIKQMTGGDPIRARFMRQDFFEYRPQFKLVIVGNHKPLLRNIDDAARRRFNIIPFVHKPAVPDRQLEEKLKAEWPAILAWAIDGCLDWQRNGLIRPDIVANATNAYFSEQDSVRQWIEEHCETGGPSICDTTANLFASWSAYALANGEKPGTTKWFSQVLQRQGYDPVSDTPGHRKKRGFLGITVKAVDTSFQWQNRMEADDVLPF